jgi:hydrogenase expression/formation protein HypC
MCLAIPGKVTEIDQTVEPRMGLVDFGGVKKRVCLEWLPEVVTGDYVIVHVGFAISRMEEKEAMEALELLRQMGEGIDELNPPEPG